MPEANQIWLLNLYSKLQYCDIQSTVKSFLSRVHAGGPGLERGIQGQAADFNVWTREAGHGSLAISVEGPSKAEVDFNDRKDGSCHVSYVVEEPGEYSVGIRFNDTHIPGSPYKVQIG